MPEPPVIQKVRNKLKLQNPDQKFGLGLCCFTSLSTIFQIYCGIQFYCGIQIYCDIQFYCGIQIYCGIQFYCGIQIYCGIQFYWCIKPLYQEKTTNLLKSLTNFNVVLSTPCLSEIRTLNVSGDRHWLHR